MKLGKHKHSNPRDNKQMEKPKGERKRETAPQTRDMKREGKGGQKDLQEGLQFTIRKLNPTTNSKVSEA